MKNAWLATGLILILGITVYANSFQNPFIWDDANLIVSNPYIKNARFIKELFTKDLAYGTQFSNFYRPLQSLSFALDYRLWGLNPFGFHLTNLLLHIACALAIYFLFASIFPHLLSIPLISALLFLIHPIQTEAVTYISGRADPQVSLFMLLSIIFYMKCNLKIRPKNIYYLMASIFCFILALLSKETALILPFLILLYDISFSQDALKFRDKLKWRYIPFLLAALIYILLRGTALNFLQRPLFLSDQSLYLRLFTSAKIFILYLGLLFLPLHLHMERSLPIVSSILDKGVLPSLIILVFLTILIVKSFRRSKIFFFAGMWFFLNLLPVSNIVPLNANMAEHWLYLPSLGLFLLIAYGFDRLFRKTKPVKILSLISLIIIICFYSFLTIKRNYDWKDPQGFFEQILAYNPESAEAHNCLGAIYQNQGKLDLAVDEFNKAIEADIQNYKSYGNLGVALRKKKEYYSAISAYKKALKLRPDIPGLYNNLANVYGDKGEWRKAEGMLKKALELFPEFALGRANLGRVYFKRGDINLAIKEYKKAIALEPNLLLPHYNLAVAYHGRGEYDLAIGEYKKVINIAPSHISAHLNLGTAYNVKGCLNEAIEEYREVLKLNPSNCLAYHNLGVVYFKKKDYDKAKDNFLHALKLDPQYKPTKDFLNRLEKLED